MLSYRNRQRRLSRTLSIGSRFRGNDAGAYT
jgi:hypothetical protein